MVGIRGPFACEKLPRDANDGGFSDFTIILVVVTDESVVVAEPGRQSVQVTHAGGAAQEAHVRVVTVVRQRVREGRHILLMRHGRLHLMLLSGRGLNAEVRIGRQGEGGRGHNAAADGSSGRRKSGRGEDGSRDGRDEGSGHHHGLGGRGSMARRDAGDVGSRLDLLGEVAGWRLVQLVVVDRGRGIVLTDFLIIGAADLALGGAGGAAASGAGATSGAGGCGSALVAALARSGGNRSGLGCAKRSGTLAVVSGGLQRVGIALDTPELELDTVGSALSEILGNLWGKVELASLIHTRKPNQKLSKSSVPKERSPRVSSSTDTMARQYLPSLFEISTSFVSILLLTSMRSTSACFLTGRKRCSMADVVVSEP